MMWMYCPLLQDPCAKYTGPDRKSKTHLLTYSFTYSLTPAVFLPMCNAHSSGSPNFSNRPKKGRNLEIEDDLRNEEDLKNEDNLKNEDDLKNDDNFKNEDNLKNENDLKNEDDLRNER